MKSLIFFSILAIACALPVENNEVSRERRQVKWGLGGNQNSRGGSLGYDHQIGAHTIGGSGDLTHYNKKFGLPNTHGGAVNYGYNPTGRKSTEIGASFHHNRVLGKDVGISAGQVWKPDRNTDLFIRGGASQHIGGAIGNQRPQFNVGAGVVHKF